MPAPYESPIPGGTNTDFQQAQGFNQDLGRSLNVPGVDAKPRVARLEELRSALLTAGGAIAGTVATEARIQAIAEQRRQERIAASRALAQAMSKKKEEEYTAQEAQLRANMKTRLTSIEDAQYDILRDPRSTNAEWVMNQAVLQQQNAGSDIESRAWNDFIIHYQERARGDAKQMAEATAREANRTLANDVNLSAKTAQQTIDILATDVNSDPELQKRLIGDGKNISDRVFDYAYRAAIAAAPQLFDVSKDDPQYAEKKRAGDELLLELETRSLHNIVKPLVGQAIKQQDQANEVSGWTRSETAQLAYAEGRLSPQEYHDQMTDILRVNFAHLDPAKQDEVRSKMYTAQFNRMVQMLDTDNPGVALDRMEGLLGLSDLSLTEKNAIRQNVISEKFPKAVVNKLEQQFVSAENELRTVTVSVDGKTQTSSDPRKAQLDMLRPAERGGTTRYMDLAARMLDNLGIKPGQPLSPLQANLQGSILETVTRAEAQAKQLQRQIDVKVDVGQKLRQGAALTGEEASKAWGGGWSMSAMGGDLQPEDPVYQALSAEYKRTTGKDIPWDAKAPLVLNDQTEQIGVMLAREDAESWRGNTATDMPAAIGDRVKSFISAGNPAQVKWALNFYQGLGPAGQERLAKSLGTGKEAVWTQAALVEGSRLAFSPRVNEQGSDFAAVVQKMRSITETMANDANARAAFSAGLRYEKTPKFDTDAAKALERALGLTPTQGGFGVSGTGASAPERLIELLGSDKENLASVYQRAYIVQSLNPGADLDTAMSQVVGEMRAQGYTVADSPRGKVLIQDPYSHANFDWEKYRALQNPGAVAPSMPDLWSALEGDQKYDIGMKRIMSTRVTDRALREYGAAIGATPEDIQWAKERGSRRDWLLYRVVSQQEAQQGTQGFPLPDSWAWSPAPMYGPEFEREMGMPDGGIPMILHAPGYRPMNQLYANGRPLHSFSARRLQDVDLALVNRNRIPDNHLTSSVLSRATIPMKDDSAARLQKMTEVADEMARKTPPIGTLDLNN